VVFKHPNKFVWQDELKWKLNYVLFEISSYDALNRSLYYQHMKMWLKYFPLSQIHIVNGDRLIKKPWHEVLRVEKFLGVDHQVSNMFHNPLSKELLWIWILNYFRSPKITFTSTLQRAFIVFDKQQKKNAWQKVKADHIQTFQKILSTS